MDTPDSLLDERERLTALRTLGIVATAPGECLTAVTRALARAFDASMAAITLVDHERVWFWSRTGFELESISRSGCLCAHAMTMPDVVVVQDVAKDPRFAECEAQRSEVGWRFYAGVPVRLPSGLPMGTLCVMDRMPREGAPSDDSLAFLRDLGTIVEQELAAREALRLERTKRIVAEARLATILGSMSEAVLFLDQHGAIVSSNAAAESLPTFVSDLLRPDAVALAGQILDTAGNQLDVRTLPHRQVLATGKPQPHRVLGMRGVDQGATFWYETSSAPIASGGTVVGAVCSLLDVSRYQQVLQALQCSEHQLQAMAANVPGVIYQLRTYPDGRVEFPYISPGIERVFGITADRWREQPDWAISAVLEEDQESYAAAFVLAQTTLTRFDWEGRTRTAHLGEVIWIHCQSLPVLMNDGSVLWNGVVSDITASKRQEEALRISEQRFRLVVEQTHQMVYDIDVSAGTVVWVGTTWPVLGWSNADMEAMSLGGWFELIHPDDRQATVEAVERSRLLDEPFGVRYRMRRSDESYVWVYDRGIYVRGRRGAPVRMLGTISDVTAEVTAMRVSEESLRRTEALLVAIPDTVVRLSSSGVVLDVRHAPAWMGEDAGAEHRVVELKDLLPVEVERSCLKHVRTVVDQRTPALFDLRPTIGDRQIDLEVRVSPSGTDEAVMVIRDATEQRAVERLKGQFVSTVSHELRTPLASIRGALGLMTAGITGDLSPMTQELSELALENTKRLERLINDLLDLESSDSGELRLTIGRFELRQLLERNLHAVAPFAASMAVGLRLETDVGRADAMVDADRFGQIVSNLLSNAIKHSRPDCDVVLSLQDRDDVWRVEVHNQGNPIPESFRARMFQRFAMADASDARKRGGTGLGLAIARALVERMDGRIDYTSDETGTRFFVELPRAKAIASRAPELASVPEGHSVPSVGDVSRPRGSRPHSMES